MIVCVTNAVHIIDTDTCICHSHGIRNGKISKFDTALFLLVRCGTNVRMTVVTQYYTLALFH